MLFRWLEILGASVQQIFESLVEDDLEDDASPTTRLVPALAERVTVSDDGRAYRFALRKGVRFHDGAVFDAQAMCLNFARMRDPASPVYSSIAANYNRIGVEWIDTITVVDPFTVDIKLSEPFPDFLRYMTQEDAPGAQVFVSPDALRHFGPDLSDRGARHRSLPLRGAISDSPRKWGDASPRNEAYWGEPAKLKTLRFHPYPDASERLAALLDGTVDLAYGLDGADLPDLRRRRFVVHSGSVPYIWYLIFNMSDPVLADCRVRQGHRPCLRPRDAKQRRIPRADATGKRGAAARIAGLRSTLRRPLSVRSGASTRTPLPGRAA